MSIDLRSVFERILREWGHDVYLQKVANFGEPNAAPRYTTDDQGRHVLEKHTTRHTYPGARALGNILTEEIEGMLTDYEVIYYFKHDVNPRTGDRIYENIVRYPNNLVTFIVDTAIPMRGKGGRIEFWATGATKETH